jgi:uncharacterized protein YukJ
LPPEHPTKIEVFISYESQTDEARWSPTYLRHIGREDRGCQNGQGLDYLRDNLFPVQSMAPIPPAGAGVTLANLLDAQIERAKADKQAIVLACGEFFRDRGSDQTFNFSPEQGVHDIHMMQGNSGNFADDNRVNGDGAFFIRYVGGETVTLFARVSVQDLSTDDATGAPVPNR